MQGEEEEEETGVYAFVGEMEEATEEEEEEEEEEAEDLLHTNKQTNKQATALQSLFLLLLLLRLQKNCNCKISQLSGYSKYDCTSPYPTNLLPFSNPTIYP